MPNEMTTDEILQAAASTYGAQMPNVEVEQPEGDQAGQEGQDPQNEEGPRISGLDKWLGDDETEETQDGSDTLTEEGENPDSQEENSEGEYLEVELEDRNVKFKKPQSDEELKKYLKYVAKSRDQLKTLKKQAGEAPKLRAQIEELKPAQELQQRFEKAQGYLDKGFQELAMKTLFSEDKFQNVLDDLVEREIEFRQLSPEEQEKLRSKRKSEIDELRYQEAQEEIERLKTQPPTSNENTVKEQYKTYVKSALDRFSFEGSEGVDDDTAEYLDDLLFTAARSALSRERKKLAKLGEDRELDGREVRKIVARERKRLEKLHRPGSNQQPSQSEQNKAQDQAAASASTTPAGSKGSVRSSAAKKWLASKNGTIGDLYRAMMG